MIKVGKILVCIGSVFWFIETAVFGFNELPFSSLEEMCDTLSRGIIVGGLGCIFFGIVEMLEYFDKVLHRISVEP